MDYEEICGYSNIAPPKIPKNADPEKVKQIWDAWLKKERKINLARKRKWEKELIPQQLPEVSSGMLIKQNGVWKQNSMIAFTGSAEDNSVEVVSYELPSQDRHFQARGSRGGKNKKSRRKSKKEIKRQSILKGRSKNVGS